MTAFGLIPGGYRCIERTTNDDLNEFVFAKEGCDARLRLRPKETELAKRR